ncbi:hypothetical protein [Pseudomonas gingeri]
MIRYDYDPARVHAEIALLDGNWLTTAASRTSTFLQAGKYDEKSSIWSTVKPVFMTLQKNKCVFCERQFENRKYGTIEWDLEHFRPKSSVLGWPCPARHATLSYPFSTGGDSPDGYYWLAYDLENYAASCKVCNSPLKSNFFPVGAVRGTVSSTVTALTASEQPFLCYPIGVLDVDPETLITFDATTAVPVHSAGPLHDRAKVIIDFFGLNTRDQLHYERAESIVMFGGAFHARHLGVARDSQLELIAGIGTPHLAHANCLRAYHRLWQTDVARALDIFDLCNRLVASNGTR